MAAVEPIDAFAGTLWPFEVLWPADSAARDPDLVCAHCQSVLCTIEHGDTLQVLVGVARDHVCASQEPAPEGDPE